MKRLLLLLCLIAPLYAIADFQPSWASCNFAVDSAGRVTGFCSAGPVPMPTPSPTPTPAPVPVPTPAPPPPSGNVIQHNLLSEGSGNYVFDGDKYGTPQGSIQALKLPMRTTDGRVVSAAKYTFTDYIEYTPESLKVEIAFSRYPGDFTYYKSEAAAYRFMPGQQPYYPCGDVIGAVGGLSFGPALQYDSCAIPANEQWYLNWRIVGGCPSDRGFNCGQVLVWHLLY